MAWRCAARWVLGLGVLVTPFGSRATVYVEDSLNCVARVGAESALAAVLERHSAGELSVTLVMTQTQQDYVGTLRVVAALGDVILDRRVALKPQDCASAAPLFSTMLDTLLRDLPRTEWQPAVPAEPAAASVVIRDVTQIGALAYLAADSRWFPVGASLEAGATLDVGSARHRLTGSAALRCAWPQGVGSGHFLEVLPTLGLGWRYATENVLLRAEVRSGGLMVAGYGFAKNRTVWLPWLELQAAALWSWNKVLVGPGIGVSPLRHEVVTTGGASGQVPWLHLGVVIALPLWAEKV